MLPSERVRAWLLESFGDLDRYLALSPLGMSANVAHSIVPVLKVLLDRKLDAALRLAASRAAIDLTSKGAPERSARELTLLLDDDSEDVRIRINCAVVLLAYPTVDRIRILAAVRTIASSKGDAWAAAVARAVVAQEDATPGSSATARLLAFIAAGDVNDKAAALLLLQHASASTLLLSVARGHLQDRHPRLKIAAGRLAVAMTVGLVAELGRELADSFLPLAKDDTPAVRALVPSVIQLFANGSLTTAPLAEALKDESDIAVKDRLQRGLLGGRVMAFPG